ncbi:MAG: ABC transporter permease [Planctomycetes bacterium]|nr:ABC transporter permease [Planctomycetota bacterium]
MKNVITLFKRELKGYFATPVAYVFIVVFLVLVGGLTFKVGKWFDARQANLQGFFTWHPWLYLFLIPAISMRLWAEERRQGTIELLFTLPVTMGQAVIAKFFAAWCFTGIALALTFPMWVSVNYLGDPDNGVILASYVGSLLMAGAYLAIGSFVSAWTKNQVIAFVISVSGCFLFILMGTDTVLDFFAGWMPRAVLEAVASFSFLTHFQSITKGVIDFRDLVFFGSLIACFLFMNAIAIELKKAD